MKEKLCGNVHKQAQIKQKHKLYKQISKDNDTVHDTVRKMQLVIVM
jgi:hypothetical protein